MYDNISGAPNKIKLERSTSKDQCSVIKGSIYSNEYK